MEVLFLSQSYYGTCFSWSGIQERRIELHVANSIASHVKWSRTLGSAMLEQSLLVEETGKDRCKHPVLLCLSCFFKTDYGTSTLVNGRYC